jgi:hypothetical protein
MRLLDFSDGFTSASAPVISADTSTTQTIANNQSATNVTGLVLTSLRGAVVEMEISRKTTLSELRGMKRLVFLYDSTSALWYVSDTEDNTGADTDVTITVSGNQVQYESSNQAGASYVGTAKWTILRSYNA